MFVAFSKTVLRIGALLTTILNEAESTDCSAESVTVKTSVDVPLAVGLPIISPALAPV